MFPAKAYSIFFCLGLIVTFRTCFGFVFRDNLCASKPRRTAGRSCSSIQLAANLPSWEDLQDMVQLAYEAPTPVSIDSVLDSQTPAFSRDRPTLFRERHGWCPYSERVWLTLELGDIEYDTVRIDNTGGPRPNYFGGQTPQMKWPDGRRQGESMDLVYALDEAYPNSKLKSDSHEVRDCVSKFSSIFPKARPSSRAAFLFQWNGEPLCRRTFEETLHGTNELLGQSEGPFFCGSCLTAADVAWAPFLERYRYQLPCLHEGLNPYDESLYPHLAAWYKTMDQVPAYACRVKGDASSWRKVLSMAGFGNAGIPPQIGSNMDRLERVEFETALSTIDGNVWTQYASTRPYLAETPSAQAALTIMKNREYLTADVLKSASQKSISSEKQIDIAMRATAHILVHMGTGSDEAEKDKDLAGVGALATFLDRRMCVPRDMGAMSAASIKHLAWELSL